MERITLTIPSNSIHITETQTLLLKKNSYIFSNDFLLETDI